MKIKMKIITLLLVFTSSVLITSCATQPGNIQPSYNPNNPNAKDVVNTYSCEDINYKRLEIDNSLSSNVLKQEKKYTRNVGGHVLYGVGLFIPILGIPMIIGGAVLAVNTANDDGTIPKIAELKGEKSNYDTAYNTKCFDRATNKTLY